MTKKILFILLIFFKTIGQLTAQSPSLLSNLHQKNIHHPIGSIQLDSLPLLPQTAEVFSLTKGKRIPSSFYRIEGKYIIWLQPINEPVKITYRTLSPLLLTQRHHLDSLDLIAKSKDRIMGYNPYQKEEKLIDHQELNYQGSFSRGISFGNNQNLVLDSRFNLQLGGKLKNDIEIAAVISDENLPIQAEGNTRQLKEFDKIFIQLKKDDTQLIAGDYQLQSPDSYFMRYFKKLQGATFETKYAIKDSSKLFSRASIAISRGQFAKNNLDTQEGNQGPYKLRGNNGERFIIILAGTEKVWLDGKLLIRGIDDDYTIDYNQAEITFTTKNLIKRESRILVEFEYSAQKYLRSMYETDHRWDFKKGSLYFNFYSEQDSKNSSGELGIDDMDKLALSLAGDDPQKAIISTIDTFAGDVALHATYRLSTITQICNNRPYESTILIYSNNQDSTLFTASFSNVGSGNGNYLLDNTKGDNEKVYRYIAPDPETCQPQGTYEPIGQLIPPQKKQLLTFGSQYQMNKNTQIQGEIALSNLNLNRYSNIDNEDNQGLASFLSIKNDKKIGSDSSGWHLTSKLQTEWTQATFTSLNTYRAAEFARDWNLTTSASNASTNRRQELIGIADFTVSKDSLGQLSYSISGYDRKGDYRGRKHRSRLNLTRRGWHLNAQTSYLTTKDQLINTSFLRPDIQLKKLLSNQKWQIGLTYLGENNQKKERQSNLLQANSFRFDEIGGFITTNGLKNKKIRLEAKQRTEYFPNNNELVLGLTAQEIKLEGRLTAKKGYQLQGRLNYRNLTIQQPELTEQKPAATYLGRINFQARPKKWKGLLIFNATYEIGSGQAPKQSFSYLEVAPGSGTHIWQDSLYNNDGIIQLNEMEIAPFQDQANYILVRNLSDEYIQTNNVSISHSLDLNPKALWFKEKKGLKKWIKKLATKSSLQINRKTRENPNIQPWNPYQLSISDTSLVSGSILLRNNLFFNRGNSLFNLQIGQSISSRRFVQTTGLETRSLQDYHLLGNWNITPTFSLQLQSKIGQKQNQSGFYPAKDYLLDFREIEPQLTYLPNQKFKANLSSKIRKDINKQIPNGEQATQKDLSLELSYRNTSTSSLELRLSYVDVQFQGNVNTPVGFAILNGLQKGANILWSLNLNRQLNKSLQINIGYDGRKTGTSKVIHTGRAQVRALF